MRQLYQANKDFKEYVDRYVAHYNEGKSITLEEALTHKVVHDYAEWLHRKQIIERD